MHDGFAQVLGYVNTKAQAVRHLLATGRTTKAAEMVAQLEEAAREVYVDVREAILGLRATDQAIGVLSRASETTLTCSDDLLISR